MTRRPASIGVIGAGAWGTALAVLYTRNGHSCILWSRSPDQAERLATSRINHERLPGVAFPAGLQVTAEPMAIGECDIVLVVIPAQTIRNCLADFPLPDNIPLVICAKGFEQITGKLMSTVVNETKPHARPFVLSGPSFAQDVARGFPTAVTLAGSIAGDATNVASALSVPSFRIYASDDLKGVQIGGALKNVLAIACGISDGRGLGKSARAALTTRAFAELTRLGRALGAENATLAGLSGLGDLLLTCGSPQSRNYRLGRALGRGTPLSEALSSGGVSEGAYTAAVAVELAQRQGIDAPICQAVASVLSGASSPEEEIQRLLSRPLRSENEART